MPPRNQIRTTETSELRAEVAEIRAGERARSDAMADVRENLRSVHQDIRAILARTATLATTEQVSEVDTRVRAIEKQTAEMKPSVEAIPALQEQVNKLPRQEAVLDLAKRISDVEKIVEKKADKEAVDERFAPLVKFSTQIAVFFSVIRWLGPAGFFALIGAAIYYFKMKGT